MEDLIKIIKWRDEIHEIEYTIARLELAEQTAVDEEKYEFTKIGTEIFKRANSYYVPHSYREYILNLDNILDKKINISTLNVDRDENIIGSGLTHMRYFPPVLSYFAREKIETVVDVGCGMGHSSIALANFCNQIVGLDPSPVMLTKTIFDKKAHVLAINLGEEIDKLAKSDQPSYFLWGDKHKGDSTSQIVRTRRNILKLMRSNSSEGFLR